MYVIEVFYLFQFQRLVGRVDGYGFADDHMPCPIDGGLVIVGCLPPVLVELLLPLPYLLASGGAVSLEVVFINLKSADKLQM